MLRITRGISGLLTLVVLAGGCAKSQFNLSNRERATLAPVQESRVLNAQEAPMPAILPETHYAAGRLFESQGSFGKALEQYSKAVAVNPDFAKGYHRMGLVLSKMSRHDDAVNALQKAVTLSPADAQLRNNYGFELMFVLQWDEAERQLRRAIELEPKLARAHVNLAMALSKQHRFDESLQAFRAVLPEPDAYYNLGLLYRGQQRYEEARDAFEYVLELNPEFSAAHKQLHELVRLQGGDSIGATKQRVSSSREHQARTADTNADIRRVVPRSIGETRSAQATAPRTFWKRARTPEQTDAQTPAVRSFTATNRFDSEAVNASELIEMSYLDEYPAPVVEGDLASSVAIVEDELDCIRNELESDIPGFVAGDEAVVNALEGVPSPYVLKPSPFIDEGPIFSSLWDLAPPAGSGVRESSTARSSVPRIGEPVRLIGSRPHRLATAVAKAAGNEPRVPTAVRPPVINPMTGNAFARATWPDAAQSGNPRFHKRRELAAMDETLDLVRERIRSLEQEHVARSQAYAAARSESYRAQLASSSSVPQPQGKFTSGPNTLRDFAEAQLMGMGPESLASILSSDESRERQLNKRNKKSLLIKDKPASEQKQRSRPRTDAKPTNGPPSLNSPAQPQPWYMPLMVSADEVDPFGAQQSVASNDSWFSSFDELDSLIAIIRNEIVCEGGLKTGIALPASNESGRGADVCTLDPEPIMSELPPSVTLKVCDPSQPDGDVDSVTMGDARSRQVSTLP